MPRYITERKDNRLPTRHNQRSKDAYVSAYGIHTVIPPSGIPSSVTESSLNVKFSSSVIGSSNPHYKSQIKAGLNATTAMIGEWVGCTLGTPGEYTFFQKNTLPWGGLITVEKISGYYAPYCVFAAPPHPGLASLARSEAQSLSRLYAAIRKLQSEISGPTFLGELREAVQMVRKPGEKMFKSAGQYLDAIASSRKHTNRWADRGRAATYMGHVISNAWLELSFGWKPLLSDVEAIAVSVARMLNNIRHGSCRGFGEDVATGVISATSLPGPGQQIGINLNRAIKEQVMTRYKCGVKATCDLPVGNFDRLRSLCSFRPEEFFPTAWELLPWSFLADYFGNIGDCISASVTDTSQVTWVNKTVRRQSEWSNKISLQNYCPSIYYLSETGDPSFGSSVVLRKSVARSIGDKIPSMLLQFELPGSKNQFANMVGLLLARAEPARPPHR